MPTLSEATADARPFVWRSRAMGLLVEQVERVARSPRTTVLVQGESGTGKELVARLIHQRSATRGAFVALNCAALNETLLEAELFGHAPGAFTGAAPRGRDGLLAAAAGGTLLLDEIGELALPLQAKLLRALQERSFRRLGEDRDRPFEARVVACTNRDLESLVRAGSFREDLFYRLNVLMLRVPTLRQRAEDVEPLARHFAEELAPEVGRAGVQLSQRALEALRAHAWPGNVRELRNRIERALLLSHGDSIGPEELDLAAAAPGPHAQAPESADSLDSAAGCCARCRDALPLGDRSLSSIERALIERVLSESNGNRTQAARVLGFDRTTLYSKLRRYGLR